jgi:hypothetical protein
MPRGDVSAMRCVPGDDERVPGGLRRSLGRCPSCGEPVMPGLSFCRFCGCPRASARDWLLHGAVNAPPAGLRVRVAVVTAPGPGASTPARNG